MEVEWGQRSVRGEVWRVIVIVRWGFVKCKHLQFEGVWSGGGMGSRIEGGREL